jgi:hypothetical protein
VNRYLGQLNAQAVCYINRLAAGVFGEGFPMLEIDYVPDLSLIGVDRSSPIKAEATAQKSAAPL